MNKIATFLTATVAAAPLLLGAQAPDDPDQTAQTAHAEDRRVEALGGRPTADPAGEALALRDELDLTGQQVAELENIQTHHRALNEPLLRQLRAAMPERPAERPRSGERRPGGMRHRSQSRDQMAELRPLMQELRANNRKAENEVAAVLAPEQQAMLDARRAQQRQEVRAEMRERMRDAR